MGFGTGAFQAAKIAIDGVTVIQEIFNGKISSYQTNNYMVGLAPTPAVSSNAWGYGAMGKFLTSPSITMNAQLTWPVPANYASIIDGLQATGSIGPLSVDTSSTANTTSIASTVVVGQYTDMIIVFLTLDGVTAENNVTLTDSQGNTWTQRFVQTVATIPNLTLWEFFTFPVASGNNTITATMNVVANTAVMESAVFETFFSPLIFVGDGAPAGYSPPNITTIGSTQLITLTPDSGFSVLPIAYFGGNGSAGINSSFGNGAFSMNPIITIGRDSRFNLTSIDAAPIDIFLPQALEGVYRISVSIRTHALSSGTYKIVWPDAVNTSETAAITEATASSTASQVFVVQSVGSSTQMYITGQLTAVTGTVDIQCMVEQIG